jgi:hypothetical protein
MRWSTEGVQMSNSPDIERVSLEYRLRLEKVLSTAAMRFV